MKLAANWPIYRDALCDRAFLKSVRLLAASDGQIIVPRSDLKAPNFCLSCHHCTNCTCTRDLHLWSNQVGGGTKAICAGWAGGLKNLTHEADPKMAPLVSLSQLPARLPTCVNFTGFRPRKALFTAQFAAKMRSAQGLSVQIVCPNCDFSDRIAD